MIDRNIGNVERAVRFVLGAALVAWIIASGHFGLAQAAAALAAFALLWNSIFARCYLWKWLRISSLTGKSKPCPNCNDDSNRV